MRQDLTDITLVVDRSGSMESCRDDAEGGINAFIKEQKDVEGDAMLTLVQFDDKYDFVHRGVPIGEVPAFCVSPRGMTALLDAIGRAITETGERLDKLPEDGKPGCVVFVIVTDGHENASKEFKREDIRKMIERQKTEYNWQFMFLGADQQAFDDAVAMGVPASSSAKYDAQRKSSQAYSAASRGVTAGRMQSAAGEVVNCCFSPRDREEIS